MKLNNKVLTLLLSIITVAMMLPAVALAAEPIVTDRDISFTISYKDEGKAISDATFDVYHCANVDAYGQMTVTDAFSTYPVNFSDLDQDGWQELATTLKGYAQRDNLSTVASGKTDRNGELSFTLKPGLYLVVGSRQTIGEYTYTPAPFMVFLPGRSTLENVWDYDVSSYVKFTKKYNPSDNPPDDDVVTRKALKIWNDYGYEYARPEEITVQLLRDGEVSDTQVLNADNNWCYTWDNLSDKYEWTIVEKELSGYLTTVTQRGVTFTITNKYIVSLITEDPPVAKKITGDTPASSSTFTFILTAANADYPMPEGSVGTTKEIRITGSGSSEFGPITFTKPGVYTYTVSEKNTGVEGYTYDTTVYTIQYTVTEQDGNLVLQRRITDPNGKEVDSSVFTNKYSVPGPSTPQLPHTGSNWWPVPLLFCLGMAFYVVGFLSRRKQRNDE